MAAPTNPNAAWGFLQTGYDPTGHQYGIALQVGTVAQDATTGIWYAPLQISGSISATNPSVSATGAAVPASATYLGGINGGNLVGVSVDSGGRLILGAGTQVIGALTANQSVNQAQVAGTTTSINAGTADAGTQRVIVAGAATNTKSTVASSASSVTILASNTSRKGASVYNDSTQILYLDESGGAASSSSYTTQVPPQQLFELPGPTIYNGAITGIWASANGNARVKETT